MPSSAFLGRVSAVGLSILAMSACTSALGTFSVDDSLANDGGGKDGSVSTADGSGTSTNDGGETTDGSTGSPPDAAPPATCSPKAFRFAFVTSEVMLGNFGSSGVSGVLAANKRCNNAAAAAKLPGNYAAWLSDNNGAQPGQKFLMGGGQQPIYMPNGSTCIPVLADPGGYSGELDHAIDHNEFGQPVAAGPVWTATKPDGTYIGSAALTSSCANWLDAGDGGIVKGGIGNSGLTGQGWTDSGTQTCNQHARLYCFQTN